MVAIAESLRRRRIPLMAVAIALLLGVASWAFVARNTARDLTTGSDLPMAAPSAEQAGWKIDVTGRGRIGRLSKFQRSRYRRFQGGAVSLVRDVYGTIFLEPGRLDDLLRSSFSGDAAAALDARKLGFPNGATNVKILDRRAEIGIDMRTAGYAVAEVEIRAQATLSEKTERLGQESKLWLARRDDRWRVVAFDVSQDPAR